MGRNMRKTIHFQIKESPTTEDLCAIEVYKVNYNDSNTPIYSYIDTISPMTKMELWRLKVFLDDYIQKNTWG
jgi:hypothetical protein